MKNTKQRQELFQRFLTNRATASEIDALFKEFNTVNEAELRHLISASFDEHVFLPATESRINHLSALKAKISVSIDDEHITTKLYPDKSGRNFKLYKIAASFLIMGLLAAFVYIYLTKWSDQTKNILPGANYATLMMSGGEYFDLKTAKNGAIAQVGNVHIYKTEDGKIIYYANHADSSIAAKLNTITTPLGGQYKITLSDGSSVILNSGSSLEFPIAFNSHERIVKLKGEAYFEVTKNPSAPFIVQTKTINTKVLGTKFNISCYEEDPEVKATLLEGKILVFKNSTKQNQILKPGEQAKITGNQFDVSSVSADDFAAWKDGIFMFNDEDLGVIMHHISRWYNIKIDYSSLPDKRLYVKINKNVNLSEVLRLMSLTSNLKFKFDEGRLSVIN